MTGRCLGNARRAVPDHVARPRVARVRKLQELRSALLRVNEAIRRLELSLNSQAEDACVPTTERGAAPRNA